MPLDPGGPFSARRGVPFQSAATRRWVETDHGWASEAPDGNRWAWPTAPRHPSTLLRKSARSLGPGTAQGPWPKASHSFSLPDAIRCGVMTLRGGTERIHDFRSLAELHEEFARAPLSRNSGGARRSGARASRPGIAGTRALRPETSIGLSQCISLVPGCSVLGSSGLRGASGQAYS